MSREKEELEKPHVLRVVHVQILASPLHCASSRPVVFKVKGECSVKAGEAALGKKSQVGPSARRGGFSL